MYGTCRICGVDFSFCPEQFCIACEINGVGMCMKCAALEAGPLYCRECMANIPDEDVESEYETISE